MSDKLLIERELLERVVKADASNGASSVDLVDGWKAMEQIRAILAAPRQPEGEGLEPIGTLLWADPSDRKHDTMVVLSKHPRGKVVAHRVAEPIITLHQHERAIAELREECEAMAKNLRGKHATSGATYAHLIAERDTLRQQLAERDAEIERLSMQLAACGVVALANTPESAGEARKMHPDYMSASCSDVADAVDREMALRQQRDKLAAALDELMYARTDKAETMAAAALAEVE